LLRRFPFLFALAAGLTAGVTYAAVDLLLACRVPDAEACVWGKAYFVLTLGLSLVLVGGAVTGVCYALLKRLRSKDDEAGR
jgi:xanthosine utilization system XapX-like protein